MLAALGRGHAQLDRLGAEVHALGDEIQAAQRRVIDGLRGAQEDLLREARNIVNSAETELREATARERNLVTLFEATKADAFEVNKKQKLRLRRNTLSTNL